MTKWEFGWKACNFFHGPSDQYVFQLISDFGIPEDTAVGITWLRHCSVGRFVRKPSRSLIDRGHDSGRVKGMSSSSPSSSGMCTLGAGHVLVVLSVLCTDLEDLRECINISGFELRMTDDAVELRSLSKALLTRAQHPGHACTFSDMTITLLCGIFVGEFDNRSCPINLTFVLSLLRTRSEGPRSGSRQEITDHTCLGSQGTVTVQCDVISNLHSKNISTWVF